MGIDIDRLRDSLRSVPGALTSTRLSEPAWLSQAREDQIVPTSGPAVLELSPNQDFYANPSADISKERSLQLHEEVRSAGIEALAWYRSFRGPSSKPWGVFIRVEGIADAFNDMFGRLTASTATKVDLAYHSLLAHELAHFYIDAAVAQLELLTGCALWLPQAMRFTRRGTYDAYEETIANAAMLRAVRALGGELRVTGRERALREWTRHQPLGYSTGYRYTAAHRFNYALNRHGALLLRRTGKNAATRWQITLAPLVTTPMLAAEVIVPLFLVYSTGTMQFGDVGFFPAVRIVSETSSFQKQLSKSPPALQRSYSALKSRLATAAPMPGDQLKKWRPLGESAWSLRLNRGDRVHVKRISGFDFEAVEIGSHRALGHG